MVHYKIHKILIMYKIYIIFLLICLFSCKEEIERSDAYGNFEATATTVSAETNGKIIYLNVEEGSKIAEGVLVALIDTTQLHLQRLQVDASMNVLPKKLRNTLADIEVLENQKANIVRERDRISRLLSKKAATSKQLDDLNGQIEVVERQIDAIRSNTDIGNRAILAEIEPLIAQKAIIDEQIKKCYIYNPVQGTVLTKLAEEHEVVRTGGPLYRIGQLDTLTLRLYADAVQLQSVALGNTIQVLIDEGSENLKEVEGRISWISDEAEFTPKTIQTREDRVNLVYAVKAEVANPHGNLKIGMPAEANFEKKELILPE